MGGLLPLWSRTSCSWHFRGLNATFLWTRLETILDSREHAQVETPSATTLAMRITRSPAMQTNSYPIAVQATGSPVLHVTSSHATSSSVV
jgi:hypothetical protein